MAITWPLDPTVYAGLLVLYLGHAWLARRVTDAGRQHTVYFLGGLFTVWLSLETPIDTIADYYLDSVHMLQHVLLGFVAPPLLLLGVSPEMAGRLLRIPGLRLATEPVPAQLIAGVVMVVWHLPALYDATLRNEELHILEHVMFIGAAPGARLVYMLLATLPQDGVALVLIFSRTPFYEFYTHAPRLIQGFTALIDQTIAGAVLMVFGKVTLGIAAGVVFFRWFGAEHRADRTRAVSS